MTSAPQDEHLSQLDKFKQAARDMQADDDPERFKERLGKLVRQKPVDKSVDDAEQTGGA